MCHVDILVTEEILELLSFSISWASTINFFLSVQASCFY